MIHPRTLAIALLTILFVSGCAAHAQDANSARAWISSLYSVYTGDGKGIQYDDRVFDSSLLAVMRADDKAAGTEMPAYADFQLCDCQDWNGIWHLNIAVRMSGAHRATANVSFALAQPPAKDDLRHIRIQLVVERGEWRIDDVCGRDGWCLRAAMEKDIRYWAAPTKPGARARD